VASELDGPVAEFNALRQEIQSRSATQQNIFALQVTTAGALFGFALSGPNRTLLLLILPVSSYLLFARYLIHSTAIAIIGEYIRDTLTERLTDGLGWEQYWQGQPYRLPLARWVHPNLILFSGVSVLALIWTAPAVLYGGLSVRAVGIAVIWLLGSAVAGYTLFLTWTSAIDVG
jgi:hypothetical protein